MKKISEAGSLTMNWVQNRLLNRKYTLISGEHQLASLFWVRGKSPHALGQADGRTWRFHSSRVLYPRVSIQSVDQDNLEAIFEDTLKGQGNLIFTYGPKFHWDSTDFWNNVWEFSSVEGKRLVKFVPEQALFKIGSRVVLEEDALGYPELPLLIITGWYLLVSMNQEDSGQSGLTRAISAK